MTDHVNSKPTTYSTHATWFCINLGCILTATYQIGGLWWAAFAFGVIGICGNFVRIAINRSKGIWP